MICGYLGDGDLEKYGSNVLLTLGQQLKVGNISFIVKPISEKSMEVDITCETDQVIDFGGVEGTVSCTFEVIITSIENPDAYNFKKSCAGSNRCSCSCNCLCCCLLLRWSSYSLACRGSSTSFRSVWRIIGSRYIK